LRENDTTQTRHQFVITRMLTIVKNMSASLTRHKYARTLDHPQWSVWDTDQKKKVYGPTSHRGCIKFMDEVKIAEEIIQEIIDEEKRESITNP